MLNSDDDIVQKTARKSFSLHMSKRKAQLQENVEDENVTFGGYEVDESGYVKKHTKQCLSKSSWIELNEICVKLGFQLQYTDQVYKLKIHNDVVSTPQKIYKLTVKSLTEKDTKLWKELNGITCRED